MIKPNDTLTFDRAKTLLSYDCGTGILRWNELRKDSLSRFNAGCLLKRTGYIRIRVDGIDYQAHRVAWLLYYGEWPKQQVDHINQVRNDNRIINMRDVSRKLNSENVGQFRKVWKKGASFHTPSGLWKATIGHNYKRIALGYFKTMEDAQQAYMDKKRIIHLAFTG